MPLLAKSIMSEGAVFGIAEIEDDDRIIPIENSHLSWGRCACGTRALFDPASVSQVRCGGCLALAAEKAVAPDPVPGLPPLGQGYPPAPPAQREPYPAPEISSRDEWDGEGAPRAVETLAAKARKLGWRVKVQRSRGCLSNAATGRPGNVKNLWGAIFTKNGASAYAVRDDEKWIGVMLWGVTLPWFPGASVTQLIEYLQADGQMPAGWYDAIRGAASSSAARTKARAACNRGVHMTTHVTEVGEVGCSACGHAWPIDGEPWRAPKRGREGLS